MWVQSGIPFALLLSTQVLGLAITTSTTTLDEPTTTSSISTAVASASSELAGASVTNDAPSTSTSCTTSVPTTPASSSQNDTATSSVDVHSSVSSANVTSTLVPHLGGTLNTTGVVQVNATGAVSSTALGVDQGTSVVTVPTSSSSTASSSQAALASSSSTESSAAPAAVVTPSAAPSASSSHASSSSAPIPSSSTAPQAAATGATALSATKFAKFTEINACVYPARDKYPVTAFPVDEDGGTAEETVSIRYWYALRMDEWLNDLIGNCPAVQNGEAFSQSLGVLLLGLNDGAWAGGICNDFRCAWGGGTGWSRGDMFVQNSMPCFTCANNTASNLEFVEKTRRWYALQVMGNIWDHQKATAAAMQVAQQAVAARVDTFLNTWAPAYTPAQPPVEPLSGMLGIFKGLAAFIPGVGPEISLALAAAGEIWPSTDSPKTADPADVAAIKQYEKTKDAVKTVAKGVEFAVDNAFKTVKAYKDFDAEQAGKPEHWDPVVPVSVANFKDELGGSFSGIASAMQDIFSQSIDGPPLGPSGYLTLATGGLYSTWAKSAANGRNQSLAMMTPTYVAWSEDKLLMSLMRSYGVFFIHEEFRSLDECNFQQKFWFGDAGWKGALCFQDLEGKSWRSLTPYSSNLGLVEDLPVRGPYLYEQGEVLHQLWPHLTDENIQAKLRGPNSKSVHPTNLTAIYQSIYQCYAATNAGIDHVPIPGGSSTGYQPNPAEYPDPKKLSSPLENICHWNMPVITISDQGHYEKKGCLSDYPAQNGVGAWSFRTGGVPFSDNNYLCHQADKGKPRLKKCDSTSDYGKMNDQGQCCGKRGCVGGPDYMWRPGGGLYYARALAYPANPKCVLGTANLNCQPYTA